MKTKPLVFLGGSINPGWREIFIELSKETECDFHNPVVTKWSYEAIDKEEHIKHHSDVLVYCITSMNSAYSIAEVVKDSNSATQTIIIWMPSDYKGSHDILREYGLLNYLIGGKEKNNLFASSLEEGATLLKDYLREKKRIEEISFINSTVNPSYIFDYLTKICEGYSEEYIFKKDKNNG